MTSTILNSLTVSRGLNIGEQANPRRKLLESIPGLTLDDVYQGNLLVNGQLARITFETVGLLRVELAIDEPSSPLAALQQTRKLPGHVRHANVHGNSVVLAEVALGDASVDKIRRNLDCVRVGLAQAMGSHVEQAEDGTPLTKDSVSDALAQSSLAEEDIVDLETQWEIRIRWHEEATVVRVQMDGGSLRFSRVLTKNLPKGDHANGLAHHALRLNGQLRQCRLAATETQLVAETLLPGDAVIACNMVKAARAITVAASHCSPTLTVLASQQQLAREYTEIFIKS